MVSFMGLMDAVSIFPSLVDQLRQSEHKQSSLPFIRFVRVLRLLRLMRLVRAAGSHSVSGLFVPVLTRSGAEQRLTALSCLHSRPEADLHDCAAHHVHRLHRRRHLPRR
jgi:hypothetical protein